MSRSTYIRTVLIIIVAFGVSQMSYGQLFVYGEQENSKFGTDIGISEDGDRLVVGIPQYDYLPLDFTCALDPNCDNGRTIVYELDTSFNWMPLGSPIIGEEWGGRSGQSVDISADGKVIIIGEPRDNQGAGDFDEGQVRVFEYDDSAQDWVPRGLPFTGLRLNNNFGHSVDISDDGNTIVIGAPYAQGSDVGEAQVFRWTGFNWAPFAPINGATFYEYAGSDVAISGDGNYVIVGAYGYNDQSGRVYVYDVSSTGLTNLIGTFQGDEFDILFGYGVAIDGDGDRIAITASFGTIDSDLYEGTAHIFEYDPSFSTWTQVGQVIAGTDDDNGFDQIEISADGNVIAISASSAFNDQDVRSGKVYFYEYDGGAWILMEQQYQGEEELEQFGQQIDMSKDAEYIAIGTPLKNAPSNNEGAAGVGTLFPQNLYLNGNPTLTGTYYAISTIYAQGLIPSGEEVEFSTGDSIVFEYPWAIELGAILEAFINP